jgi:hypothetical protein
MRHEQTMAWGAEQYRDVLDELAAGGLHGEFVQTGGMCAAIEVMLDGGHYLLFTDLEDSLSWDRQDHEGWFVGLYEPEDCRTADGPLRWLLDEDGSPETAVKLARRLLRGESEI